MNPLLNTPDDHAEELTEIEDKQKKATEVFRKKVKKLIDDYSEEFKLNFVTNLRLQVKTRKLNEGKVELHGILFNGNLSLMSATQFIPEEVVEKIVRYTIYTMACQYEQLWSDIKGFKVGAFKLPDIQEVTETHYGVDESGKYHITMPYEEIQKIQEDYKEAVKQFCEYMDSNPTWNTKNHYFYEIKNIEGKEFFIQLVFSSRNITDEQRAVCDKVNEHFPSRMQKENWQWRTCFVTKHSKVDEEMSEDKIYENLNKKFEEIKAFEEKVKAVM